MQYRHIRDQQALERFAREIADAPTVAFDTEFISEDSYRPELCLLQVAVDRQVTIIDALAVNDLVPFWERLADRREATIVHAGREELRFCLDAVGKPPHNWFDVQIAAGFVGLEYPASYGTLLAKVLDKQLSKGETRTDWRRRPLSDRQLEYAVQDVMYLESLRERLLERLVALERVAWLDEELTNWQQEQITPRLEPWRRLSGTGSLGRKSLAIARELWQWRDDEARQRNRPPRRVLRDDLIVELSRRQSADLKRIRAIRGLERSGLKRQLPELAERIERALSLPKSKWPEPLRRATSQNQFTLLGQFLNAALGTICRRESLAPTLVGTVQDVRDLIADRLGVETNRDEVPQLMSGWRGEVIGKRLDGLLHGVEALRVVHPLSEQPLDFVRLEGGDDHSESAADTSSPKK